jgi:hypothetical protein
VLLDLRVPGAHVWTSACPLYGNCALLKLFSSVTSYTIRMPIAPR